MKNISMLGDLLRSAFRQPVTELYPLVKRPAVESFRGMLHWTPEDCTGCALCVKDCPAEAIELITIDKATKRFVFKVHVDRCTFCGQCVYNCRFGCIEQDNEEWELANLHRDGFTVVYGRPEDVEKIELASETEHRSEPV